MNHEALFDNVLINLDFVIFIGKALLKFLYDKVEEKEGQVSIRCAVPIDNLLHLVHEKTNAIYSFDRLKSERPLEFLRVYTDYILADSMVIIDLGESRRYSKVKRANK